MQDQLFEGGEVLVHGGVEIECASVSYQEDEEGNRHSFVYTFRRKSELDAEREAAEAVQTEEVPQEAKSKELQEAEKEL